MGGMYLLLLLAMNVATEHKLSGMLHKPFCRSGHYGYPSVKFDRIARAGVTLVLHSYLCCNAFESQVTERLPLVGCQFFAVQCS